MNANEMDTPGEIPGPILQLLGRHSTDIAFICTDGELTWIDPRITDLLGHSPEGLLGTDLGQWLHPDDEGEYARQRSRLADGHDAMMITRMRHARGQYVPVEVLMHPFSDQDGASCAVGTLRDVAATLGDREATTRAHAAMTILAERAGDLLFVVDGNGTVVDAGIGARHVLGWLPEEMTGMNLVALIDPEQQPEVEAYRKDIQADTARGAMDVRVRTRGGAMRWFHAAGVRVTPHGVDDPEQIRVLITWRDIEPLRREIRYAERESERLRVLLDSSIDPWMLLSPIRDRNGRIADFRVDETNQTAAEYLGWPRSRIVGMSLLEEFPGIVDHGLMSHYINAMEFGEPVELEDVVYPHEVLGETRRYTVRAQALSGTLMLTWRDTTSASLARDELALAEAHFRGLAIAAGDALVRADDRTVAWASPNASAMGLRPGVNFEEAMAEVLADESRSALRTCGVVMAAPGGYTGRWIRADGSPALVVRAQPLPQHAGDCVVVMIEEAWTEAGSAP